MGKRKRYVSISQSDDKSVKNGNLLEDSSAQPDTVEDACIKRRNIKWSNTDGTPFQMQEHDGCADSMPEQKGSLSLNKTGENKAVPLRVSARVLKKLQKETSPQPVIEKTFTKEEVQTEENNATDGKRKRRPWELWSAEDISTFFEALNEYGKDFELIQNYFANKVKKKGLPVQMIKNKDQVRHFYYRTWHKISKYFTFSEATDVKKSTQELYALVNFGEMRKKIGGKLDEKSGVRLNELVYRGWTTFRTRGKTLRIKTPLCKALKRLNQVEDSKEEEQVRLPNKVTIELWPRLNADWMEVQSSAQNPRVRVTLPLQRRISSLLRFLENKWKPQREKQLNHMMTTVSKSPPTVVPEEKPRAPLRVTPKSGVKINLVEVKTGETVTSRCLSLQTYEERMILKPSHTLALGNLNVQKSKGKAVNLKKSNVESDNSEVPPVTIKVENDKKELPHEEALRQLIALESAANPDTDGDVICIEEHTALTNKINDKEKELPTVDWTAGSRNQMKIDRVRNGWTADEAGSLTVGELYLLIGSNERIYLDYAWEIPPNEKVIHTDSDGQCLASTMQKLVTLVKGPSKRKASGGSHVCSCKHSCSAASTTVNPVGGKQHACAGTSKPLGNIRSRASVKNSIPILNTPVLKPQEEVASVLPSKSDTMKPTTPVSPPVSTVVTLAQLPATSPVVKNCTFDGAFRRPVLLPSQTRPAVTTVSSVGSQKFKEQLEKFRPRYCNRPGRGRSRRGSVVVQRVLPLLPKSGSNTNASASHSMVTLQVIPNFQQRRLTAGSFVPLSATHIQSPRAINPVPRTVPLSGNFSDIVTMSSLSQNNFACVATADAVPQNSFNSPSTTTSTVAATGTVTFQEESCPSTSVQELHIPDAVAGAQTLQDFTQPSLASLLEFDLSSTTDTLQTESCGNTLLLNDSAEKLLDVALGNSNSSLSGLLLSPIPKIARGRESQALETPPRPSLSSNSTPPSSPSRILKDTDNQWLNGEVSDFSLSSFLGHLESPSKSVPIAGGAALEDTRLSSDVDSQLQCLMTESSVDYTAKFADLAAQIAAVADCHVQK